MTVPSSPSRNTYTGTGLLASYDYGFRITSAADLLVTKRDTLDVETTLTYPTDYLVSGVGNFSGGTITLTAGNLPSGYTLVIRDDPALVQTSDIRNQGDFFPEIHEDAFDYAMRAIKSQQDQLDRSLILGETETGIDATVPPLIPGYVLHAKADGSGFEWLQVSAVGVSVSAFMLTVLDEATDILARAALGVPAAANGSHTGTTAVETLAASVAATVPTVAQGDADTSAASTAFVAATIQPTFSYIFNGDGRLWGAGFSASPSGWGLTGAGATVARDTTAGQFRWSAAGVSLTRSGTDCALSQTVTNNPAFGPAASWAGKTITVGAWVYATVAGRARVTISDSVTTVNSAFHPGDSTLRFLTATMTVAGGVTAISMGCSVSAGNTTATFSGMTLALGSYLQDSVASYGARKCVIPFHVQAGATISAGTTGFYHSAGADTAESNANVGVPFRGVARNLYCNSGGSPGIGQTFIFTMRRAGADTILTATISGAATSANDTTNQAEYTAGQNMCLRVVSSGGASTVGGLGAYIEYEEVPV